MNTSLFLELPLIGILRGFGADGLEAIVSAVLRGGMTNLEITMNSPGAADQIRKAVQMSAGNLNVGAGTVTSPQLMDVALASGASFIVTPTLNRELISRCVQRGIPVFPGALSPWRIWEAWEAGATMVKIFPADYGGATYLRSLRGPFPQVKLMPTGGVDLKSLPSLLKAGANGFGIGSPLFSKDRIVAGDWSWLESQTRAFVDLYRQNCPAKSP